MVVADNTFWFNAFQEHGSSILAFLTSRVGRRELAEDLLQETFLRVMRRGESVDDTSRLRAYLFTTAHHLVIDRSRRSRPVLFSEVSQAGTETPGDIVDHDAAKPDAMADLSLFTDRLGGVLATLPPDHATAFRAAVLEQRSYADVAAEQGWSLGRVKSNVHRARKAVVTQMREMLCPATGSES
jgi:RNA polymerase sigma-70 factor (ECF subfamily)